MHYRKLLALFVLSTVLLSFSHLGLFVVFINKKETSQTDRVGILYYATTSDTYLQKHILQHTLTLANEIATVQNRPTDIIGGRFSQENEIHMNLVATSFDAMQWLETFQKYDTIIIQFAHDKEQYAEALFKLISIAKGCATKIITTLHHSNQTLLPTKETLRTVRTLVELSDAVTTTSEFTTEALKITHAVSPRKLNFIPFHPPTIPAKVQNRQSKRIISYACENRIGLEALLVAFELMRTKETLELIVCSNKLYQVLKEAGLDNVIIKIDTDSSLAYQRSGLYVNLPLMYPELADVELHKAMAANLPVISFDYGYSGEMLFHSETPWWEYLVDRDSAQNLAAKMQEMLNKTTVQKELIGYRNREILEHRGTNAPLMMGKQYLSLIQDGNTSYQYNRRLSCDPMSPYAYSFTRTGYINFNFVQTFDGKRFVLRDILPEQKDIIINFVSDPVMQINGKLDEEARLTQIAVVWFDGTSNAQHSVILDTTRDYMQLDSNRIYVEYIPQGKDGKTYYFGTSSAKFVVVENNMLGDQSLKAEINVANSRYLVELAIHKILEPKQVDWIDVMLNVQNDMVGPHGILGQSLRTRFMVDTNPDELFEGSWEDYLVKDGIMGNDFAKNLYNIDTHVVFANTDAEFCTIPQTREEIQALENSTVLLSDNPHLTTSGFSTGARDLVLELIPSTAFEVIVRDIYDYLPKLTIDDDRVEAIKARMVSIEEAKMIEPDVVFRMRADLGVSLNKTKQVYYTPWEYRGMLKQELVLAEQSDHLWAITNYVKQCYLDAGIPNHKVAIVPHGVSMIAFDPPKSTRVIFPEARSNDFIFLFRGGAYPRKGLDFLLDCFMSEFTNKDDVTLIIHTTYGIEDYSVHIKEIVANRTRKHPRIIFNDATLSDSDSLGLYHQVDCYLSPYRSEGFGLTITEAMAAALPVIITDYSGPRDFANPANSYLIPAVETECHTFPCKKKAFYHMPTTQQALWSQPDKNEFRRLLRHVTINRDEAAIKGLVGRKFLQSFWTMERAARMATRSIRKLSMERKKDDANRVQM